MIKKSYAALIASSMLSLALFPLAGCTAEETTTNGTQEPTTSAAEATLEAEPTEDSPAADDSVHELTAKIRKFIKDKAIDKSNSSWRTRLPTPPKLRFKPGVTVKWHLDTTEGDIVITLMPEVAPMHVSSTMYLSELGFYDDLTFHRILPNFMAQGGCPLGSGMGNPGYKFGGEISRDAKHVGPGILSAANTGRPNSDGSQFFLTFVSTPWLDGKHTVYGKVSEGLDIVKKLESFAGTQANGGRPKKKVLINTATVTLE